MDETGAVKSKCLCGAPMELTAKFCSQCGEPAIAVRSQSEIKMKLQEMNMLIELSKKIGNPFIHDSMVQSRDMLLWSLGQNKNPVAFFETAINFFQKMKNT